MAREYYVLGLFAVALDDGGDVACHADAARVALAEVATYGS